MRNGQNNNNKRMRNNRSGGGNNGGGNNHNNNRRGGQNPMTRVFESNGPDIKIRGTASHIAEKYVQLARDARTSSDPVAAENYYQHAEHYFRLIAAAQEQFRQSQPQSQQRMESDQPPMDGEDDSENYSNFGAEPGFAPSQPQAFVPREQPRDAQPYQPREVRQPREEREPREQGEMREQGEVREARPPREPREQGEGREMRAPRAPREPRQPRVQPQPQIEQQSLPMSDSVGLPSFITGGAQPQPQPPMPASYEAAANERFTPRRRRRPHPVRTDDAAAPDSVPTSDDVPSS